MNKYEKVNSTLLEYFLIHSSANCCLQLYVCLSLQTELRVVIISNQHALALHTEFPLIKGQLVCNVYLLKTMKCDVHELSPKILLYFVTKFDLI